MALTLTDNSTAFHEDPPGEEPDRYLAIASVVGVLAIVVCLVLAVAL